MPLLSCSVETCVHYKNNYCCRPNIQVKGSNAFEPEETCCHSFEPRDFSTTNSIYAYDDEPNEILDVGCDAYECEYNVDSMCNADAIDIGGRNASNCFETECETFTLR